MKVGNRCDHMLFHILLLTIALHANNCNGSANGIRYKQHSSISYRPNFAPSPTNIQYPFQTQSFSYNTDNAHDTSSSHSGSGSLSHAPFNPLLSGGNRQYPGVKLRFNHRAFKYATSLFETILNSEVQRAHIPAFRHCIPQVNGCVTVYNLFVSRYRCPQRVIIYPAPPNRFIISTQNLDIGITGNIGGQIEILVPLGLSGIAHANAHQVSITIQTVLERSQNGASQIRVVGCTSRVGYVDAFIENGGMIGDIINSQFRATVSRQVQLVLPRKICESLPKIIVDRINPKLYQIPQSIPLTQITSFANGFIGRIKKPLPQHCLQRQCQKQSSNHSRQTVNNVSSSRSRSQIQDSVQQERNPVVSMMHRRRRRMVSLPQKSSDNDYAAIIPLLEYRLPTATLVNSTSKKQVSARFIRNSDNSNSDDPCAGCSDDSDTDPMNGIQDVAKLLDMNKIMGIALNTQLHRTYATPNDYTIGLNGEFYGNDQGHVPFYPFPMYPPLPNPNSPMVDALLSDFTINSLAYQLQNRGFISFKVGPETPKIGALLKTTCSDDEYDDTSVELDDESEDDFEGTEGIVSKVESNVAASMNVSTRHRRSIHKRQANDNEEKIESIEEFETESTGGLADLGICIGDIMPAVREAHPNKNLTIQVHTAQAPSVIFSSKNGGTATIDLLADAEIYLDDETSEKVGTIQVRTVIECAIQSNGDRVAGTAQLSVLKLKDPEGTLGLSQDTFDNLANLAKGFMTKMANDALKDGFSVDLPTSTLPISILRPHLRIVDHAILLSADLLIKPSLLGLDSITESNAICRNYN